MDFFTSGFPILTVLIFLPLVGAIITAILPDDMAESSALAFTVLTALLSLFVIFGFDPTRADFQFVERYNWIDAISRQGESLFKVEYLLGLDGISLWLIPLTTLLMVLSVWFSSDSVTERKKEYYAFMLLLETGMLGVFVALDLFLFFIFWEIVLIPMYFLIGIWGGSNRIYATMKFVLYTMAGSALMLAAIMGLGMVNLVSPSGTGQIAFAFDKLLPVMQGLPQLAPTLATLPANAAMWFFLAFALAFAIKVPLFPFHTWLPDAHVQAPTAGSVILAGILLKMGTYGYLRFALPFFPEPARDFAPLFALLAIIGILYGAWVAYAQKDIKSLVAYSSVSHLGFVMLGIFALNAQGLSGGILQMINHGISTGALFLLVGMIYERRHTRDIDAFGGLWKIMPIYAAFFLITMLASVGLPGLNGFVGEFLALLGAFAANPWWALFGTLGVVLAATYMLRLFNKMFFGPVDRDENRGLLDLTRKEVALLVPLVILMVLVGFAPNLFLDPMQPSVNALVEIVNGNAPSIGMLP